MSTVFSGAAAVPVDVARAVRIPPLQTGDRLSRDEFERRYRASPQHLRAELIEGIVYIMVPPVSADWHGVPHFELITLLGVYRWSTPGTQGGDNTSIRLDLKNEPQPDAYLRVLPNYGGQSQTSDDKFVVGAPELVAEVAASSASYDLHEKLTAYLRNGVQEYVVWRTYDQAVDWFVRENDQFVLLKPDSLGILKSLAFPGLWLASAALLRGDDAQVEAVLRQGLASPEHQAFVERLASQRK